MIVRIAASAKVAPPYQRGAPSAGSTGTTRTLYWPGGTAVMEKDPSAVVVATFTGIAFSLFAGSRFTVAPMTGGEVSVCASYGPLTPPAMDVVASCRYVPTPVRSTPA